MDLIAWLEEKIETAPDDLHRRAYRKQLSRLFVRIADKKRKDLQRGQLKEPNTPIVRATKYAEHLVALIEADGDKVISKGDMLRFGHIVGQLHSKVSSSGTDGVIWPDKGRWYCHSCQQTGDVIDYVALRDGISRQAAADRLATKYGRTLAVRPGSNANKPLIVRNRPNSQTTLATRPPQGKLRL